MILVFGKNGQVAQSLAKYDLGHELTFLGSAEANFLDYENLPKILNKLQPEIVINAAAYTLVDRAETERDACQIINAKAVGVIADWCAAHQVKLIHYSTDYVFSGAKNGSYSESDETQPLNWYGSTKLEGEKLVLNSGAQAYIFRVSWVFSEFGTNFVKTMVKLGKERTELKIVNDQEGSPTYAGEIARLTLHIVDKLKKGTDFPSGVYHMSGQHNTNWHYFASEVFKCLKTFPQVNLKVDQILPIPSSDYPTPARRSLNSKLDNSKFRRVFQLELIPWYNKLSECLELILKKDLK